MRNSFTFYRSFLEGIEPIEPVAFKRLVIAMARYAMNDEEPELDGLENALFVAWKANIDASNRRKANGLKGGRPKTEPEPNETETKPKITENNRNEPNVTEPETLYEIEIERKIEKEKENKKEKEKRFQRPTLQDIKKYCEERRNNVDAQQFYDFYESKGWKVGNAPMKDWRAAVRTWERRKLVPKANAFSIEKHSYDFDELERELAYAVDNTA